MAMKAPSGFGLTQTPDLVYTRTRTCPGGYGY